MKLKNTMQIGDMVKSLRENRNMTRSELSENVGISESHLNKIETGIRQPGIKTYRKIMEVLDVDFVIVSNESTIQGRCAARASEIMMRSNEEQARDLLELMEFMSAKWITTP